MLEEKYVEANLSMCCGMFRNHSLLAPPVLGEAFLELNMHGQDHNLVGLNHSLWRDGFPVAPCISWAYHDEPLSSWAREQRFVTLSIAQVLGQFDRAIMAATCSKGDAECSSKLH
jgi:hypothetical protein